MAANQVKIAMITGYLGAGKTTLLNHILTNKEGIRAAVIVNDIGEVNIDAELIANNGAVSTVDDSLVPMENGCICCTLSEDLENQLREFASSGQFDYIIIEASGICEPEPIAWTIAQFCEEADGVTAPMTLDNIIAVVDCARMRDEFNSGRDLLSNERGAHDIASLLVSQIEFCSTLILNKTDIVTPEELAEVKAIVGSLQKGARVIEAQNSEVDLKDLLNTGLFDFDRIQLSAGWVQAINNEIEGAEEVVEEEHECECTPHHGHDEECSCGCHEHHHHDHDHDCECGCRDHDHDCSCGHHHHEHGPGCSCGCHGDHDHVAEFGITTFVYERRRPFNLLKLDDLAKRWPASVIRCKGIMWVDNNPDDCVLFEQAGRQISASQYGIWLAAADPEQRDALIAEDPSVLDTWDPEYGDRRIKLVFIGKGMNREEIEAQFDACLA